MVLTGSGRAFCAGADLKEVAGSNHEPASRPARSGRSYLRPDARRPQTLIAAVTGLPWQRARNGDGLRSGLCR
ncbi:enoyl-CoA hydratase-related protein [Pseudosulfitobacter pseudonitzschiae]|uniref:enoyl-CoA hydratase-related protein n=1 Tax=Pseudosulfitobacter pseudonitzschiae TaxID=1402135 RepID=UPI0037C6F549